MKTKIITPIILLIVLLTTTNCNHFFPPFKDTGAQTGVSFITGEEAVNLLSKNRKLLFDQLRKEYNGGINLTMDVKSKSILLIQMTGHSSIYSGTDHEGISRKFLNKFVPLIDPMINPIELVDTPLLSQCDDMHLTYKRVVESTPVLGSNLTVRFSGDGTISQIENALASISAENRSAIQFSNKNFSNSNLNLKLSQIVNDTVDSREMQSEIVYVPVANKGKTMLEAGNHYLVADKTGNINSLIYLPESNKILGPYLVGDLDSIKLIRKDLPQYHLDEKTGIPDFITFRSMGGIKVEALSSEINPAEIVYRFLDHYPSMFRTGAPRCQFAIDQIMNFPELPHTSFIRMNQVYIGMPVFGAQLIFEIDSMKKVMSVIGHSLSNIFIDPSPKISASKAILSAQTAALAMISSNQGKQNISHYWSSYEAEAELGVFPGTLVKNEKISDVLAFKVNLGLLTLFVDASDGRVVYTHTNEIADAPGTNFIVRDATALSEFEVPAYTEVNNNGNPENGGNTNPDVPIAVSSLPTIRSIYGGLGWAGLDNNGLDYIVNTNVLFAADPAGILPTCPNAFFTIGAEQAFFCLGEVVPDVVAHELTHGVIAHSARLIPAEQPGALNESFADIMGELIFPDPPPLAPSTIPTWISGTGSAGGFRNLANPALSTFPGVANMAAFLDHTTAGCTTNPLSCDAGFVHFNSQINSLAYVLLADGTLLTGGAAVQPLTAGIGRQKARELAFMTITTKLTPWSGLIDSRLGTYAVCQGFFDAGRSPLLLPGDNLTPSPFTLSDLDQVHICFQQVGLDPDMISGWPVFLYGRGGTQPFFAGETTDGSCPVVDNQVQIKTPSGYMTAHSAPSTPVNYFGLLGVTITTGSVGTSSKAFIATWFNTFLAPVELNYASSPPGPFPPGTNTCLTVPPGTVQLAPRASKIIPHPGPFSWFGTDASAGNSATGMPAACTLVKTEIEIVDANGNNLAGPSETTVTYSTNFWSWGSNVTVTQTATINTGPPGPPNLSANVSWSCVGLAGMNYKLVYILLQPAGTTCGSVE